MMVRRWVGLIVLCLTVCSCQVIEPSPVTTEPPAVVAPSETPTPPRPITPTPTATAVPPPVPTPTATAAPEVPLSAEGPWVVVVASDGVWVANGDGSGLTRLTQDVALERTVSVSGQWVAYVADRVVGQDGEIHLEGDGLVLRVLSLPDGVPQTVVDLRMFGVTEASSDDLKYAAEQVARSITWEDGGPTWSPDGTALAFASGHEGTSGDLYAYAPESGDITRLSEVPGHAYQIRWSPDGRVVFHTSASNFGSGAGYVMEGVWVSLADGSGTRSLYALGDNTAAEEFVAWAAPDAVLVNSWWPDCGGNSLRLVNVVTGDVQVVWPNYFRRAVHNPETGTTVLDVPEISCNPDGSVGYYLVEVAGTELAEISEALFQSQVPKQTPELVPETLRAALETQLKVTRVIWVER